MFLRCIVGLMLIVFLSGCATTQKPSAVNQLQIRVAQIENQLDAQDQDVSELKYAVETLVTSVDRLVGTTKSVQKPLKVEPRPSDSGSQGILRVPVTPQEVQEALKSSGYYDGAIDGNLGSGSQRAIKAFQKDHDLQSDGIIGKKTWAELKNYLE